MQLETRELSFSYPSGRRLFENLSLFLSPGRITFLLGANGSGKSTLLKLLCGLLHPAAGGVWLADRPLAKFHPAERARHLGVMLQQPLPVLDFTVEEVVLFGRSAKLPRLSPPRREDLSAAARALEAVGMSAYASRRANTLSGGEFQRVVLASTLALESEILLFDEPFSAQDPAQSVQLLKMLREKAREKTVLVISHDLALAARCGERLLLLEKGTIFADGSPREVLTRENLMRLYNVPEIDFFSFEKS